MKSVDEMLGGKKAKRLEEEKKEISENLDSTEIQETEEENLDKEMEEQEEKNLQDMQIQKPSPIQSSPQPSTPSDVETVNPTNGAAHSNSFNNQRSQHHREMDELLESAKRNRSLVVFFIYDENNNIHLDRYCRDFPTGDKAQVVEMLKTDLAKIGTSSPFGPIS